MTTDNGIQFQFRWGPSNDTPSILYGVYSAKITWALDSAPHAEISISNLGGRRSNFFNGGDRWEIYAGYGGIPDNPLFIGRQPPSLDARYNSTDINLNVIGYSSRMAELSMPVEINEYTGWDVMVAVRDRFSKESTLNVDGIYGSNPIVTVAPKSFAKEVRSHMSVITTLMKQAINLSDIEHPTMYHWREIPINGSPAIQQVIGIDRTDTSFSPADVLTPDDFLDTPRDWRNNGFNAAWYKISSGEIQEYFFDRGLQGKVHSTKTYNNYEEARLAVANSVGTPSFQIPLTKEFLHLRPGDVIQITGTNSTVDGYFQIYEVQHVFDPNNISTTIRLSESSATIR